MAAAFFFSQFSNELLNSVFVFVLIVIRPIVISCNIASSLINIDHECKYLGLIIDSKLSYRAHISSVTERLGRQCGVISKLRHFVPRYQSMKI